ncbi:hypothetical protein GA0070622_4828 [Micromonospora sediminicola]|uniref:PknH-like extracellular domain-containing protein n=1 Tax=Micromonospora sediminicola TaxID=946078 RepID=A0A1A9BFN0_9ACTN|nr:MULTISPECIES: hypothetical protein [Micromonospora]SBT67764.1 hypothetical protein GA0070622_4828 [Micromonospora sediminicola]
MTEPGRRNRRLLGLPLLATAMLVGACADGGGDAGQGPTSTPAPTPTTSGTPSPSSSGRGPVTIPRSAFVDLPGELRKSASQPMEVTDALPRLCAEEFASGGRSVTASAAMTAIYKQPKDRPENVPYGTLNQTVFAFEDTGATDYLRRVRAAVTSCRSFPQSEITVTVRSEPMAGVGDDALLVTLTRPATGLDGTRTGGTTTSQITVVQVADAVSVVHDQGWEGTSNNPDLTDDFARATVRSLDSWQR